MSKILTPAGWKDVIVEQTIVEDAEYGYGYHDEVDQHHKAILAHAKKNGYTVNHNDHGNSHTAEKPGSKPHAKPHITVHYERGDKAHRDSPSGITIHKGTAAYKDKKLHSHADKAQGDEDY